jgi:hypothetical protein
MNLKSKARKEEINPVTNDDFDGALRNLGRDRQGLEEGGLLGTEAGVLSRDDDIARSDTAGPGWRLDLVLEQRLADVSEVFFREHEPNVAPDVRQQPGKEKHEVRKDA